MYFPDLKNALPVSLRDSASAESSSGDLGAGGSGAGVGVGVRSGGEAGDGEGEADSGGGEPDRESLAMVSCLEDERNDEQQNKTKSRVKRRGSAEIFGLHEDHTTKIYGTAYAIINDDKDSFISIWANDSRIVIESRYDYQRTDLETTKSPFMN